MEGVQAQFHILVHWELDESTLHAQDSIIPRYGGSIGRGPLIHKLRTS
jgi:hypothetical protein